MCECIDRNDYYYYCGKTNVQGLDRNLYNNALFSSSKKKTFRNCFEQHRKNPFGFAQSFSGLNL